MNYYNEFDPYAAKWLRNLISAGHLAPGNVDERSIEDVTPNDLAGYSQCHFFAGIGVWPLALRRAGWPDDRQVWSGSCPCQPFSAAGKGNGFDDERHLWPAWQHLISERRPAVILGEQVASKAVDPWIDLVCADLEGMGYAFGAIAFPSAGVGAPHIRDRTYWMGHADDERLEGLAGHGGTAGRQGPRGSASETGVLGWLADADGRNASAERQQPRGEYRQQPQDGGAVQLADPSRGGRGEKRANAGGVIVGDHPQGLAARFERGSGDMQPGPTNGFWRNADWLGCRDDKWRPVEPGTFPLAHGATSRVGRLRAYGNAINLEAAVAFIGSYLDSIALGEAPARRAGK